MIQNPETAHFVHAVFEAAAMFIGARYYFAVRRRSAETAVSGRSYGVLLGCLLGAGIGNKLVYALEWPQLFTAGNFLSQIWAGQSVVGGLLGGLLGTELAKWLTAQSRSTGDLFVGPFLLALAIGRVGCFLAGLNDGTCGVATSLPWGLDFGDGMPRHPAQLYEIAFVLLLWWGLARSRASLACVPGLQFKLMTSAYLLWRLLIDFLKPVPFAWWLDLSGIQWVCLAALAIYLPHVSAALQEKQEHARIRSTL
ncbi:prolipoprotein diacylglyceryl transferase [Uliginosibacterium paludis]|uniref:Prolipoprotein diacylglyceryl transferase family protein n=1 Tax=Uliginosibacterium paludis TaxID=1615952 RepID=A0ABV2CRX1_9RHOO